MSDACTHPEETVPKLKALFLLHSCHKNPRLGSEFSVSAVCKGIHCLPCGSREINIHSTDIPHLTALSLWKINIDRLLLNLRTVVGEAVISFTQRLRELASVTVELLGVLIIPPTEHGDVWSN